MLEINIPDVLDKSKLLGENGLKQMLDAVDQAVINKAQGKVFECHYLSLIGQWVKGKGVFDYRESLRQGGVGVITPSYYELSKMSGRGAQHLKRWEMLYLDHPDEEEFKNWAHNVADKRTIQWGEKVEALSDSEKDKQEEPKDTGLEWLKCLAKRYSGIDPVWREACKGCLTRGLCGDIAVLVEQEVMRMQKKGEE